ncbi:cytochrome P450 [Aspergillus spinulosporus]
MFSKYLLAAGALGVLAHWGFFVHGEHDLRAPIIAQLHVVAVVMMVFVRYKVEETSFLAVAGQPMLLVGVYTATLLWSTLVYRIFLSPLKHIDGPWTMRLSKLAHVWKQARYRNFEVLDALHERYGDVIRTGPNEVTVFGTDAYYKVHGKESRCTRAAYYDILQPLVTLTTYRTAAAHASRRRIWDLAFSPKAVENLEPLVYEKAELLLKQLQDKSQQPLDISSWFEYYTFDLMGEIGLSVKFENLDRGSPHPILTLYHLAHRRLAAFGSAPWMKHLVMGLPFIARLGPYKRYMGWATTQLQRNISEGDSNRTDLLGRLITHAIENGGIEANWRLLLGDFVLLITAASDPIHQVLVNMLYYLLREPAHLYRVREELKSIDIRDYKALQQSPHLNACIYETLRLNPGIPSAGLRVTPPEGLHIGEEFIPGGTTIVVPQYSLFRDSRNFVQPLEWIPERFSSRPDLILNRKAFVPWGIGQYACIGRQLSLMEIRIAAAMLLTRFDCRFAPGEDGQHMFSEALDHFTTTPGPLRVVLQPQSGFSKAR